MDWSNWQPLEKQSSHSGPAVYELRMVRGKNNPVSIPRFLGGDKHGLLSIGRTTCMESRRKQLKCGVENGYRHSEGNLFHLLSKHARLSKRFRAYQLEFRYCPVADEAKAKSAEERLVKGYICDLGEAPPLNSVIHGRYGPWKTEDPF